MTGPSARPIVAGPPLDSPRNPFEVFLLLFGLVVGAPLLFGAPTPGSTTTLLGPGYVRVWAWMLVLGCAVTLIGAFWTALAHLVAPSFAPTPGAALLIEQVGLVAVGASSVIYVLGAAAYQGPNRPVVPAGIVAGLAVACLVRAWLIQRWVKATIAHRQGR